MFNRKEIRLESLHRQLEFFESLEHRHLPWASDLDDAEIREMHFSIIDLLTEMTTKYEDLLRAYHKKTS